MGMNVNKSCGPDDILPKMLIQLIHIISVPITLLFKKTMRDGDIPRDWKLAFITAIYKKGSKGIAGNYRPISFTSLVYKLIETFVKTTIMNHLASEKLLSPRQFGFINGRSTTMQLLNYLNKCIYIWILGRLSIACLINVSLVNWKIMESQAILSGGIKHS